MVKTSNELEGQTDASSFLLPRSWRRQSNTRVAVAEYRMYSLNISRRALGDYFPPYVGFLNVDVAPLNNGLTPWKKNGSFVSWWEGWWTRRWRRRKGRYGPYPTWQTGLPFRTWRIPGGRGSSSAASRWAAARVRWGRCRLLRRLRSRSACPSRGTLPKRNKDTSSWSMKR